jgi:hypothetical protein
MTAKKVEDIEQEEALCSFCGKTFYKESTLFRHMCEKKKRHITKDERHVQLGLAMFHKFYKMNYPSQKQKTYEQFAESSFYTGFVDFGKYLIMRSIIEPHKYCDYLLKSSVPLKKWIVDSTYDEWLKEYLKYEDSMKSTERSLFTISDYSKDKNTLFEDFFEVVNTNIATDMIKRGQLTPWVIYLSKTGNKLLSRLDEEQIGILEDYLDVYLWEKKFELNKDIVPIIKEMLKELKI